MAESINDIRGQKIKDLVEEMKLYNNPQELEDMKKLMRKNVPFMMRGYLLAYLYVTRQEAGRPRSADRPERLKRADRPQHNRQERTEKPERSERPAKAAQEAAKDAQPQNAEKSERKSAPRPVIENATSFYINIGKASRTSVSEIKAFILEKTGLNDEDIVSIACKQNYSFVYVRNEKTEGICEAVTGQVYNNRKVKMNPSRENSGKAAEETGKESNEQ